MRLKVLICSSLISMQIYANGDGVAPLSSDSFDDKMQSSSSTNIRAPKPNLRLPKDDFGAPKGESSTQAPERKWFDVSGYVGYVSTYSYRGISESLDYGAIQGEIKLSQKKDEGFYAGMWGSNVDFATAPNGSSLELSHYVGYAHKFNPDFSVDFRVQDLFYPGCYAGTAKKDSFDMLEFIPGFTYKWFTFFVAVQSTNVTGLTPSLIQELVEERDPSKERDHYDNTKWSFYTEGSLSIPVPQTEDRLKLKLLAGYWKIRNYSFLSYARYVAGVTYLLPKSFGELLLSAYAEKTTARDRFWTNYTETKGFRLGKNKFWVGISKEF